MRILMFMWNLGDLDRFVPRFKALKNVGIDIHIIYNYPFPVDIDDFRMFESTPVAFNPYPSYGRWLWSRKAILKQVKDIEFDAVFSLSGIWFQYYSEYIAEKMNKPYILFLRGDGFKSFDHQKRSLLKSLIRWYVYNINGWSKVDLCIPITSDLIPLAQKMGVPPVKISEPIGGGINLDVFKPMKKPCILIEREHVFTVGYAGRISREKGSRLLQKVVDLTPDIRYLMAGKIQDKKFKVRENVIHLGEIPHQMMPYFYNDCDLLLMTSFNEGFPRVLLEAYACGLTALVTVGSVPRDCNLYGVSTAHTHFHIIKWLNILKDSPESLKQYGESALYYAGMFGLKRYAKEMRKALDTVIR